ncbi:MAG: hypothetical protein AAB417_00525 [Patescibacteria group bacterium]
MGTSDGWGVFLGGLAGRMRSVAPALNLTGKERDAGTLWIAPGQDDEETRRVYDTYYLARDPRRPKIQETPAGGTFIGNRVFLDRELVRSEFFNDFLRPRDFFHIMGGVPIKEPERMAVIRLIRPRKAPPFGNQELRLLRVVMPHLTRALHLHCEIARVADARDSAHEVLDRFRTGVILLDREGKVITANLQARAILDRSDGLLVKDATLTAESTAARSELASTVAGVQAPDGNESASLRIPRSSGKRPLGLLIARLRGRLLGDISNRAAVVVFVSDPDEQRVAPIDFVRQSLGLTKAQARLVVSLAAGGRLKDIAEKLGITYATARRELFDAFKRTGVHRQKDLIGLVVSSVGSVMQHADLEVVGGSGHRRSS